MLKRSIFLTAFLIILLFNGYAETGIIVDVTATSELDKASGKYTAKNVSNSSWQSWVEGSSGDGTGESISFTLKEPTRIEFLCIKNGFGNLLYYWANNRPKDIILIFDDDENSAKKFTLDDTPLAQYINLYNLDGLYSKVTLKIESVYKGSDPANDCAIDEIAVNAGISRREEYGAVYDSDELRYVYDPETQRMLKALYTLDVGEENVRVSKEGVVQVKTQDWETGNSYWTQPAGAFSGTLYKNFWPGTGGGHHYSEFKIFLNPNGAHYLFIWNEESYGSFELYPNNLKIYCWKSTNWIEQTALKHEASLNELFNTLSFIEKRDLFYDFYTTEDDDSCVKIIANPNDPNFCLPVPFEFEYDSKKGIFLPYKDNVRIELAFGSVESLKALGDWKSEYKDAASDNYYDSPIQIFAYPAFYNRDEKIIKFLSDNGYKVTDESTNASNGYNNIFSVLEAWQAGKNSNEVRTALIQAGASYTPEMLVNAFKKEKIEELAELLPLVKKEERKIILSEIIRYYNQAKDNSKEEKALAYIKSVFILLQKNGVNIFDTYYHSGMKKNITLMDDVFDNETDIIPLVTLLKEFGISIPQNLETWSYKGGSTTPVAIAAEMYYRTCVPKEYEKDYSPKEIVQKAKQKEKVKELFDFILNNGADINSVNKKGNTAIHQHCDDDSDYADVETISYLIKKGADVNIKNSDGKTPIALILEEADDFPVMDKIVQIFLEAGADLNLADNNSNTPLAAFINRNFDYYTEYRKTSNSKLLVVEQLLAYGAKPDCLIEDSYGARIYAIQYVAKRRQIELCSLLLKYGADVNASVILDTYKGKRESLPALYQITKELSDWFNTNGDPENITRYGDINSMYFELIKFLVENGADCSRVIEKSYESDSEVSLILFLTPNRTIHDSEIGKELMDLFLSKGAAANLTEKKLKKAGFQKDEIKKILSTK